MRSYISEPNKHIEDYLDYYFDGNKNFEYAVLLNGAWGSGKTWFVKQYLEKKEDQGKKICYVSLNGIAKTSLIDEAIFKSIHPILGSKGAKLAGQILKGTLKATVKIDLDSDGKSDSSFTGGIPKIELPDYLKINDNFILVFDDLERCELKKEEVLGYINYFVEQDKIKTLIVSNEEEIKDNDEYIRKKEKLIGATFSYIEDQNMAIQSILGEISDESLKVLLNSEFELIRQTFNQVGYKNLRSFKQAIFDFERFYKKDYFDFKGSFDSEIFKKVLKAFFILSLENKKGSFEKQILEFKKDEKLEDEKKIDTTSKILKSFRGITSLYSEKFMNKYNCSLNDFIFSSKLWNEILNLNVLDEKNINSELYEAHFRLKEEQPTWFKLMDFWDLPELEFERLINEAKSEIESNVLENPVDVLHTISMLIYFKKNSLINFSVGDLLPIAKKHWKSLIEVNEKIRKIKDYSFTEYAGSYGFYAKGIEKFDRFIKEIKESYEDKYKEKNAKRVQDLLELMDENGWLFAQRISLTNSEENYYYDLPILIEIDPKLFAKKLCQIKIHHSNSILIGLYNRYKMKDLFDMYNEENKWLDDVETSIKSDILPLSNKILKAKINLRILPKISEIKEEANK